MPTQYALEQMVEQQVRAWDVLDPRILDVLRTVPRELFVPAPWRELAFADSDIALPCGKRMLRPMMVGRLLQTVAVRTGEQVLEVGTGSGYLSACLAKLGGQVRSLELHPQLADAASANLRAATPQLPVEVINADGMLLADESRYDVIVLTASLPIYQQRFQRALRPGGRLFVIVGDGDLQQAMLVERVTEREWNSAVRFETHIEPMEHAPRPPEFGF